MKNLYKEYNSLLFTLAYQITGSVADAEDAVQDVFVKLHDVDPRRLQEPKAYLCKMVTNRSLDLLKSARKKREKYVGAWLPEPILTSQENPYESIVHRDLLSYAMLILLERLTPLERAVFILREALSFDYNSIAKLVDKSELNCRKLLSRARGKMGITEELNVSSESAGKDWIQQFIVALEHGEIDTVLSLLTEDVVVVSDGGGKVSAAVHPIETRDRVARFMLSLMQKASHSQEGIHVELTSLNGQTGVIIRLKDVVLLAIFIYVKEGKGKNFYIIRNPNKLHLFRSKGTVTDRVIQPGRNI